MIYIIIRWHLVLKSSTFINKKYIFTKMHFQRLMFYRYLSALKDFLLESLAPWPLKSFYEHNFFANDLNFNK